MSIADSAIRRGLNQNKKQVVRLLAYSYARVAPRSISCSSTSRKIDGTGEFAWGGGEDKKIKQTRDHI